MVPDSILLRYGEIFLKGKNRVFFENKLVNNIKKITKIDKVTKLRSRLVTNYFKEHGLLRNVFGLTSYSLSYFVEKDIGKIKEKALEIIKEKKGTFKIETKRSDKSFPIKSPDMNIQVGEFIEKNSKYVFSFNKPDYILKIEINQKGVYLFFDTIECFGGLPTGVEGMVNLLVENEASLLAGLLFMKRGCDLNLFLLNQEKTDLLQRFSPIKLELNAIKSFEELRKFNEVVVSGQNFENYQIYLKKSLNKTIMRPLIAYSDSRIEKELEMFKL